MNLNEIIKFSEFIMNKILVTGGAGYIGNHIVEQLVKKNL